MKLLGTCYMHSLETILAHVVRFLIYLLIWGGYFSAKIKYTKVSKFQNENPKYQFCSPFFLNNERVTAFPAKPMLSKYFFQVADRSDLKRSISLPKLSMCTPKDQAKVLGRELVKEELEGEELVKLIHI